MLDGNEMIHVGRQELVPFEEGGETAGLAKEGQGRRKGGEGR